MFQLLLSRSRLVRRVRGRIEELFPNWAHRRRRRSWERRWGNPEYSPFWKTNEPQKEFVEAIDSGWFPRNQRIIDVGCGGGEVSRWLAEQGFRVLGVDFSAAAIERCRCDSAGQPNAPIFEVADLCGEELELEPAYSLLDRGCFHRIVENLRPVYARNIARATVEGGHFLLVAGRFHDTRLPNYIAARSERELQEHIEEIFGDYFAIDRAEPAMINATEGAEAMLSMAFWMVRKSWCWACLILAGFLNEVAETSRPFLEIVEGLF